jgi:hypothetical protein
VEVTGTQNFLPSPVGKHRIHNYSKIIANLKTDG